MNANIIRLYEHIGGTLTMVREGDTFVIQGLEADAESGERFLVNARHFDNWAGEAYSDVTADAFQESVSESREEVYLIATYCPVSDAVTLTGDVEGSTETGRMYLGLDD